MNWFKFHHEALNDPKVQRLPGDLFKAWVNLLCLASQQDERGKLPPVEDCAFALRVDSSQMLTMVDDLLLRGLLDLDEDGLGAGLLIHDWDQWQARKPSDERERVAERVRKHRAKESNALQGRYKRESNATEKSKRERKKEIRTEYSPEFESFWSLYPRKTAKADAYDAWRKLQPGPELVEQIMAALSWQREVWDEPRFIPHPSTYLNRSRWTDERPAPAKARREMTRSEKIMENAEVTKAMLRQRQNEIEVKEFSVR